MPKAPLNDEIMTALARMVDDAQTERRYPSHSDLDFEFKRSGLAQGDPKNLGQTVGKAKRVRATLSWALEHRLEAGQEFVSAYIASLRANGGFRASSPNFVGKNAIDGAIAAFALEGYDLSVDEDLRLRVLDNLSGAALTEA